MYQRAWKELITEINTPLAWRRFLQSILLRAKDALRHAFAADDILHRFVRSSKSPRDEQRKRSIQAQAMYSSGCVEESDRSFVVCRLQFCSIQLILEPLDFVADLPLDTVILQPV